jgi:hypothetical protein
MLRPEDTPNRQEPYASLTRRARLLSASLTLACAPIAAGRHGKSGSPGVVALKLTRDGSVAVASEDVELTSGFNYL